MNYYKQGNAANAEKIKAAFKEKGYRDQGWIFSSKHDLYFSVGTLIYAIPYKIRHIITERPDYQELELLVEPKFKIGDCLYHNTCGIHPILVKGYNKRQGYKVECIGITYYLQKGVVENEYHLWTIQDAKQGDVLANDHHILILKELGDWYSNGFPYSVHAYCGIKPNGNFELSKENWCFCVTLHMHPATKEQRNLLFAKMKEAGYEWDVDKKELRKIQPHYDIANFQPFDKVLVRDGDMEYWNTDLFSSYHDEFHCFRGSWEQCIPFDGNKHLLGTTEQCGDEYINW